MARLIVVEDDPTSARILQNLLTKRSHRVHVAADVNQGVSVLEKNTLVDLIVLDNQLRGEYGWQFLEHVRKDFVFRSVPVLVYTGSSDRNSVLKYLQLGVQKILVKPYNANSIEEEINRALQFDWRGMIFEPADRVAQRLCISLDDYYKTLRQGAENVLSRVPQLNNLIGKRDLRLLDDHMSALQSLSLNLGVSILSNATESIQDALRKDKLDQAVYFINRLIPTARLMHHRALAHFGMTDDKGDFPEDLFAAESSTKGNSKGVRLKVEPSQIQSEVALDQMVGAPLNSFTEGFRILLHREVFRKGEVLSAVLNRSSEITSEVARSLAAINQAESGFSVEVVSMVQDTPGLSERMIALATQIKMGDTPRNLEQALDVLGVSLPASATVLYQWLRLARRERNPLRLEPLARFNLGVNLLARELSMKFPRQSDFAFSGLVHNIGVWLLALHYPSFFGVALSLGKKDEEALIEAERHIFSTDHCEIGAHFLGQYKRLQSAAATARFINDPLAAREGQERQVTAMVSISRILARIWQIGFNGNTAPATGTDFIQAKAWKALESEGVKLPLDPPEYLSALSLVCERVRRQVDILFE